MKTFLRAAGLAALMATAAGGAFAADHEIKMLNKGADGMMVFEPAFLHIEPGDSVTFTPTDKSHNAESIPGMMPEGAQPFKGKINQEITVTFDKEGVYGVKCMPHYAMGMIALIAVGDDLGNLEEAAAVKHPGKAKSRFAAAFEQLEKSKVAAK